MSSLKKYSPLILLAMLILLVIPMSFAADTDDINATDVIGINDADNVDIDALSADDSDNIVESSSDNEVLSDDYDYVSEPAVSSIDYTMGEDTTVSLTITCDKSLSYSENVYAYLDGGNTPIEIKTPSGYAVYSTNKAPTININSFSSSLHVGVNTVIFHPTDAYLESIGCTNNNFVPLTINVQRAPEPATVYYVNSTAGADGDGSEGSNYTTIAAAIAAANQYFGDNGGKIIIKEGSYTETVVSDIQKNLNITSEGDVTVTANGLNSLFTQSTATQVSINGITFENVQVTKAIYLQSGTDEKKLTIENCNFINNKAQALVRLSKSKPTTIKYCNFISNNLTGTGNTGGLVNVDNGGYAYTLTVSNCNIVDNTVVNNKFTAATVQELTANNNYWGSNEQPTDVFNKDLTLNNWVVLNIAANPESMETGANSNIAISFELNNGNSSGSMPDLDVTLSADDGSISGNIYTAPSTTGTDTIYAKYDTTTLATKEVTITDSAPVIKYESNATVGGSDNVDYLINDLKDVVITITSDMLDSFESYDKLYAWIGDVSKDINVMANEASATVNLKYLSDNFGFEEGNTYTIYFHPEISDLNYYGVNDGEYRFNPLTVTITGTYNPGPTVVYNSTPKVGDKSAIDYTIGNETIVTVSIVYNESLMTYPSYIDDKSMKLFINDNTIGTVVNGVKANATSFTVNLADYITEEGEFNITFHPDESTLEGVYYGQTNILYVFNNLTVKATKAVAPQPDHLYVSTPSPSIVDDYVKGSSVVISIDAAYDDSVDTNQLDYYSMMCVYINGSEFDGWEIEYETGDYTVDLADIGYDFVAGESYTLVFRPDGYSLNQLGISVDDCVFGNVTVNMKQAAPQPKYDYVSTPEPNATDYTLGESKNITITVASDYLNDLSQEFVYAWINGEDVNNRYLINGIKGNQASFTFDLALISNKLIQGAVNNITFHVNPGKIQELTYDTNYKFNTLAVNVPAAQEVVYTISLDTKQIDVYAKGDSKVITVTADYDSAKAADFGQRPMYIYINGQEIQMTNIKAYNASFTFDLADYSQYLVEGQVNNISVHPQVLGLETVFQTTNDDLFVFDNLTINDVKPVKPTYNTTAGDAVDYTLGDDKEITVTVNYDDVYANANIPVYLFIGDATEGILIDNVKANATSFTINLADYSDKLSEGSNTLYFHPIEADLNAIAEGNYKFAPLTVNVEAKPIVTYEVNITDPVSATISYSKGNATVKISVKTNYNYTIMSALDGSKMYAFINGNATGIIVKNSATGDDVRGSATTFSLNLTQFDEYLTEDVNTIVFHPDESLYASANIDEHKYQTLTVNIVGDVPPAEIKYNSTPTVDGKNSIEYMINNHTDVLVTIDCELLSQFESYDKLLAWVGDASYQINKMANEGTVTVDLYDIINANYFEEGKTYTIYFHPEIDALNDIGIKNGEYNFNPLTVTITGTYNPGSTVVYTSTPLVDGKSSADYTIGNDTFVTVSVVYADVKYPAAFNGKKMKVFINSTTGIVISDVDANATSFTINLADYITEEGEYTISFHPDESTLSWAFNGIDNQVYVFNNLTVKATKDVAPSGKSNATIDVVDSLVVDVDGTVNVGATTDSDGNLSYEIVNASIATVSNDGVVTGVSAGSTILIVRVSETDAYNAKEVNVTVTVNAVQPPVPNTTYTTTPTPNSVDYTIGDSSIINVNVDYNATYSDAFGNSPIYVVINNGERMELSGIKGNVNSFEFDVKAISEFLTVGTNTISFEINDNVLDGVANLTSIFNDLTVNAQNAPTDPNNTYVSIPTPSKVYYTLNESSIIAVTIVYSDLFEERLPEEASMFVYINGEDDRVKIEGVPGNATSFTFDLKTISHKLVDGVNNLTVHPHIGALEGIQVGPYVFNPLTVIVGATPEPIVPIIKYTGIIYVATDGNDNNDGSDLSPVATIAKAIELATTDYNTEHKIVIREGTYNEHDLAISSALDISGEGNVVIDAENLGRIFDINTPEAVNISGITFINGKASKGAAVNIKDAKVQIDNCIFTQNNGTMGDVIRWDADNGALTNSVFDDNTIRNGAVKIGEYNWDTRTSSGKNTVIENCTFNNNHNSEYGNCMGVDIEQGTTGVLIKNSNFTNNKGEIGSEHGALYIKGDDNIVDGCLFENNSMGMAAAVQLDGEDNIIKNSKFINNVVTNGIITRSGAIEVQNAAEIINNVFINNGGEDCLEGGAINIVYNEYGGDIVIADNEFINNSAKYGGAIFIDGGSEDMMEFDNVIIDKNTFIGNTANNGAVIYAENSEGTITITDNNITTTDETGAAIFIDEETAYDIVEEGNTIVVVIVPANSPIKVEVNNPKYGETAIITVTLPEKATGNVTVKFGNYASVDKLSKGVVTFNVSNLNVGTYTVEVAYLGDVKYLANSTTAALVVSKADVNLDAVVSVVVPNGTTSPEFSIDLPNANGVLFVTINNKTYNATLENGNATVKADSLDAGNYNATIVYSGDNNYNNATKVKEISVPKAEVSPDSAFNITSPSDSTSPVFSIDLPGATGNFTVTVGGKNYTKELVDGKATIVVNDLNPGQYNATVSYSGDSKYSPISQNTTVNVPTPKLSNNKNINVVYSGKATYKVLVTVNGKAVAGQYVTIKYNGKTYKVKTDKNGYATLKLKTNIKVKKYTITAQYKGVKVTNKVTIKHVIKAANKKVKKSKKVTKIKVSLKKVNGKYLKKKVLKIKFNKKTYKVKTNKKGVAIWKVKKSMLKKLKVGKKYKYTVTYGKDKVTKKLTIKK